MTNKFTDEDLTKEKDEEQKNLSDPCKDNIVKRGKKEFVRCPKCGWLHSLDTKKCRFCGAKL